MTLAPPAAGTRVLAQYRRHFGGGRAAVGQFLGGMAEVASAGSWIEVDDGRRYLDLGGYGVFILGHRHPRVVAAVHEQLDRHPLASRTFLEPVTAAAAESLADTLPGDLEQVHFVNSGAEATEAALKLARAHGRTAVITTAAGFHGKTIGALSVTANPTYQNPFRPLLPDVTTVGYGDLGHLAAALRGTRDRSVVILEPVQGEGGVVIPPRGYLTGVSDLCRAYGAMLVVDEIQTGLGRLGRWWGIEEEQVEPDVVLVGKGLSGGVVPVAAMVATPQAYAPFAADPYLHTSTFAGSPLACAAARAAVEAIREEGVVDRAAVLGLELLTVVREACDRHRPRALREVRGKGLLLGIEFADPGSVGELALRLIEHGVLACHSLNSTRVLRFTPPVCLSDADVETFAQALDASLRAL